SDSVIPPGTIRKRPHVEFVRPGGSMLLREVEIGVRNFGRKHEPVVFVASGFSQLLEALRSEHFSQRIGCIHRAIYDDVHDVNSLRSELRIERLAQRASSTHRSRMGM